ncbi:MAG: TonB-dependent receptor [Acidobacteriota bacterium]
MLVLRTALPVCLALAGFLLTPSTSLAQTGSVAGQVIHEDGSPADFMTVFLEAEDGSWHQEDISDEDGRFLFRPVPVGQYRLRAYHPGFVSPTLTEIRVSTDRRLEYELRLTSATTEEEVLVSVREDDFVNFRDTLTEATLDADFLEKLPLTSRRIEDVIALFPGVTRTGSSDSGEISVAGGRNDQLGIRVNGLPANDPVNGGSLLNVASNAIGSVRLISGGFQAEHGEQSTGIAEITLKGGSNTVTIDYSLDLRDSRIGAGSQSALDDVAERWNDALLGRDSLLGSRLAEGFALLGIDPLSTRDDDQNPVPRRLIRQSLSSGGPIVRDRLFYHLTVQSEGLDLGSPFQDGIENRDTLLANARVDWKPNQSHRLELTANLDNRESRGFTGFNGLGGVVSAPETDNDTRSSTVQFQLEHLRLWENGSFLESRLGLTRNYRVSRPTDARTPVSTQYSIAIPPGNLLSYNLGSSSRNEDESIRELRLESDYSRVLGPKGRHDFKTGISVSRIDASLYRERSTFVTDSRIADDRNVTGPPGDFIGIINTFGDPVRRGSHAWRGAFYVQDRWRASDKLTIEAGVRFDYQDFVGELFIAPRFGFALDPIGDRKTRVFGHWGLFYDNLFLDSLTWEANPPQLVSNMLFGEQQQERRFDEVSIFDLHREAQATTRRQAAAPETVAYSVPLFRDRNVFDERSTAPTNRSWAIGIERRLPGKTRLQVTYSEAKRTHQVTQGIVPRAQQELAGLPQLRDIVRSTNGEGGYRQWTVELQRPFSDRARAYLSYTQARSFGPLLPDSSRLDPTDLASEVGVLGNDRPHQVKLQGTFFLTKRLSASAVFNWQSGTPITAQFTDSEGRNRRPYGRNTFRLPSTRQLDLALQQRFGEPDDRVRMRGELRIVNALDTLNVFAGIGRFELPTGVSDPANARPLRPTLLTTGIDVPRSLELGFSISF